MSVSDKTLLHELSKYAKADIIEAVCMLFQADRVIAEMLRHLRHKKVTNVLAAEKTAIEEEKQAVLALFDWRDDMCQKYGDGQKFSLGQIPQAELERGAALERAVREANAKARRLDTTINRLFKEGGTK